MREKEREKEEKKKFLSNEAFADIILNLTVTNIQIHMSSQIRSSEPNN